MRLFNAIFGFFSFFAGLYCLLWSATPLLHAGWFIAFLVGIRGLCSVIMYALNYKSGIVGRRLLSSGIVGLAIGIVALILACVPSLQTMFWFAIVILCLFVAFLFLDGITTIYSAASIRKKENRGWKLRMVLGIITLGLAVVSLVCALSGLQASAFMIGITLFVYGLVLMVCVADRDEIVDESELW